MMTEKKINKRKLIAEALLFTAAIALLVTGAKVLVGTDDSVTGIACVWLSGLCGCFWCVLE